MDRADIEVETLLKIILALVVVWIALEVLDTLLGVLGRVFWFLRPIIGLILLALIVLWLLDRI
jgi:hypothetical protein